MRLPGSVTIVMDRLAGQLIYRVHLWLYDKTDGRIGANYSGGRIILLTTTGRKTGQRRTNPLLSFPRGGGYVVVASNAGRSNHPGWLRNLRDDPEVQVRDRGNTHAMRAREAAGTEREELWEDLLQRYPGYAAYQKQTSRLLPVVVLEPA